MWTYERLAAHIAGGRDKRTRPLQRNTHAVLHSWGIGVQLHSTDVLTFAKNGTVTFRTGGWYTVTTKDRINTYAPAPWRVYSDRREWRLHGPGSFSCAFFDGIRVRGGKVLAKDLRHAVAVEKKRRKERLEAAREQRAQRKYSAVSDIFAPLGEVFKRAIEVDGVEPPADARVMWHFVELVYGCNVTAHGSIPVRVGQTLRVRAGADICRYGLHASPTPSEAFGYVHGAVLCKVLVWGDMQSQSDKVCAEYRKVLAMANVREIASQYPPDYRREMFNAACIDAVNATEAKP